MIKSAAFNRYANSAYFVTHQNEMRIRHWLLRAYPFFPHIARRIIFQCVIFYIPTKHIFLDFPIAPTHAKLWFRPLINAERK